MVNLSLSLLPVLFPPFAALILGFALGWSVRELTLERPVSNRAVTTGLAILITLIWMLSIVAAIESQAYNTPAGLHAIMGAVAGYFFKGGGILSNSESDSDSE